MPEVFRFGPYRFFFYSNEGDPREPIHIHVRADKATAKFWLEPEVSLASASGFSARALREISAIVSSNTRRIKGAWYAHFR